MRPIAISITRTKLYIAILSSIVTLSTTMLFSSSAFADNTSVVDEIDITVPVSCSLSGTGMDTHITELHNTESDSSIGESTITAYCNDLNGFSIYAVGFTNNEYGNNYLIDSNLPSTTNIATGTATSGNTSQWAMKLSPITNTNPAPTYPIIITGTTEDTDKTPTTLNYTSFQPVPNEYALVAKRKAATDVGTNAEGSSFKTTYQAYVSPTQNAGTYVGQVRYTLVHPYNHAVPDPPSFKVLYTGRPLSTEPGEENPVTVLMSDLPQDGKYNLLGTAEGLYDKLTPDTLYSGYYEYTGSLDEFDSFLTNYQPYDGANIDWYSQLEQFDDAADLSPQNETIYLVKETPDCYLMNYIHAAYPTSTRQVDHLWAFSAIDDGRYKAAGFVVSGDQLEGGAYRSYTIRGATEWTATSVGIFGKNGVKGGQVTMLEINNMIRIGDFTVVPYWVTKDDYMVTSFNEITATFDSLLVDDLYTNEERIPTTITKVNP